jgi:catechol 2,3-dioxygenase-like lactoylglutathione lyase family enzyme
MPPSATNGKICYVEIPTGDVEASAAFYREVFGWSIRTRGDGATAFDDSTGQVSGAFVTGRPAMSQPGPLVYVMVDDAEAACRAARSCRRSAATRASSRPASATPAETCSASTRSRRRAEQWDAGPPGRGSPAPPDRVPGGARGYTRSLPRPGVAALRFPDGRLGCDKGLG